MVYDAACLLLDFRSSYTVCTELKIIQHSHRQDTLKIRILLSLQKNKNTIVRLCRLNIKRSDMRSQILLDVWTIDPTNLGHPVIRKVWQVRLRFNSLYPTFYAWASNTEATCQPALMIF